MLAKDIAGLRLTNQQIINGHGKKTVDVVTYLGAMQAQDYNMAKWAIGCRLSNVTDAMIEKDFCQNKIIRTHILRPTWHFVSPKDIRWMLQLTAPKIKAMAKTMHKQLRIDDDIFKKSKKIIEKKIAAQGPLTRTEIEQSLTTAKIATNEARLGFILMDAELDGLICSAGKKDKKFTYGLLDALIPRHPLLAKEEALAVLTKRYFTGHGPATIQDFAWWSNLSVADIKMGLSLNKKVLDTETINEKQYWFNSSVSSVIKPANKVFLLPAFDEYFIGYADRSDLTDNNSIKKVMTVNGIFNPIILYKGKVKGLWKKASQDNKTIADLHLFNNENKLPARAITAAIKKLSNFYSNK